MSARSRTPGPGRSGRISALVSSSTAGPLLRHLPLPRRSFTGTYTTIVSYRAGGRRLLLGALPDPEAPRLPALPDPEPTGRRV
ncbi:hypothetical protein V6U90_22470 [Micromonospora sp. CPCC 206060]|uniref:hypothetical protein n=1 Tax=Micromonospora sp. CPCC 206060 TaxID=3122406 RepID=UPI002FF3F7F6